jgi:hypothetical protein
MLYLDAEDMIAVFLRGPQWLVGHPAETAKTNLKKKLPHLFRILRTRIAL